MRIAPSPPLKAPSQAVWASVSISNDAKGWERASRRSTARPFPHQIALRIAQTRPALGAAAIDAKEQKVGHAQMDLRMRTMGRHNAT